VGGQWISVKRRLSPADGPLAWVEDSLAFHICRRTRSCSPTSDRDSVRRVCDLGRTARRNRTQSCLLLYLAECVSDHAGIVMLVADSLARAGQRSHRRSASSSAKGMRMHFSSGLLARSIRRSAAPRPPGLARNALDRQLIEASPAVTLEAGIVLPEPFIPASHDRAARLTIRARHDGD